MRLWGDRMEKLFIGPVKNQKTYYRIVETFINLISSGKIEYGDKLYNEQELIKMLDVSRPTLREALRVLEFLGIVTVSPRKGIIVNNPSENNTYFPLLYILAFEKTSSKSLFELRRAIQVEMVGRAAERATREDLEGLLSILEETEKQLYSDYKTFANLDYQFHMKIVECAKNDLCYKLMETLKVLIHSQLEQIINKMPMEKRKDTLRFHREIYLAIEERNASKACEIMQTHLERPYKDL